MVPFSRGRRLLDDVQHLAQLNAFDPAAFLAAIEEDVRPAGPSLVDLGNHLDGARGLFAEIDRFTQKSMRIRLQQSVDALPAQLRTLFSTTIVAYAHDAALLRGRVAAAVGRVDAGADRDVTARVMEAATRVLAVRATLRDGLVALVRTIATTAAPAAQRAARDRTLPDEERNRWGRAHADLSRLATRGEAIDAGNFAERLAQATPLVEAPVVEADEDGTAKRFSLLELD